MIREVRCFAVLAVLACSGSNTPGTPPGGTNTSASLKLETVASGLSSPVYLAAPRNDARLFVVEQPGRIRIINNGQLSQTPFLDITSKVASGGERGLLSVAFHPGYASNGLLFVYYTALNGDVTIERYRVSSDANRADPASARTLLRIPHPRSNHNGGLLLFGPDGNLYAGTGDGGGGGDPDLNGQNRGTLLGKLLRLDVDAGDPYAIPPDNPFVGQPNARGEVWAIGLRNPWRYAFDADTGMLYIADVGQNQYEEVNVVAANTSGANYGWNVTEGMHCYTRDTCNTQGFTAPVLEYDHGGGACSVTGGFVYRGSALRSVRGHYFYADYCAGWIRSFRFAGGQVLDRTQWDVGDVGNVTSFGVDSSGELYVLSTNGRVYRFVES